MLIRQNKDILSLDVTASGTPDSKLIHVSRARTLGEEGIGPLTPARSESGQEPTGVQ